MLFAVDVGNTSIGVAVFQDDSLVFKYKFYTPSRLFKRHFAQLARFRSRTSDSDVIVASVVPRLDPSLRRILRSICGVPALLVDHLTPTGMAIKLERPEEMGADRIADAVGALCLATPPLIVLDSGTAITFDLVNRRREYIGGAILPGVDLAIASLARRTAKLPQISFAPPPSIVGTNTEQSIQAGIFYHYLGGLAYLIEAYKRRLGTDTTVFATGGLSAHFKKRIKGIDRYEPDLIFHGLRRIRDIQRENRSSSRHQA